MVDLRKCGSDLRDVGSQDVTFLLLAYHQCQKLEHREMLWSSLEKSSLVSHVCHSHLPGGLLKMVKLNSRPLRLVGAKSHCLAYVKSYSTLMKNLCTLKPTMKSKPNQGRCCP